MIISGDYSIMQEPKKNRIIINLPQTFATINTTTEPLSQRYLTITAEQEAVILEVVKAMYEGEKMQLSKEGTTFVSEDTTFISREAAIDAVSKGCKEWRGVFARCEENILELPSADVVSREVFEQFKWERDIAINQLEELGRRFCEKMDEPITWEEYQKRQVINADYTITNILCPECGELLYRYDKMVLTTYPPQHRYECLKCGWVKAGR